jgi:hypothetical protein
VLTEAITAPRLVEQSLEVIRRRKATTPAR